MSNTMAPTRPLGDSSNAVATTAFVARAIANAFPGANLRHVATSCYMPSTFAAFANSQCRKLHVAMDDITSLQGIYPAWYVTAQQHETLMGHDIIMRAQIEYPIGTYNNFFFNRLGKPTLPDGGTYFTDVLPITIPRGAIFFEWIFGYNSLPTTAQGTTVAYSALTYPGGEGANNQTGAFTLDYATQFPPGGRDRIYGGAIALIANTDIESVWGVGDSREFGASNNPDTLANRGAIMTGLSSIAYVNHGVSSDTLEGWLSGPRRKGLKRYFTRVMLQYGINTFGQLGASVPGYIAGHLRAQAFLAGMPVVQIAMEPEGSGKDQNTLDANSWTRTQVNGVPFMEVGRAIMATPPPIDSGKWNPLYTDDNLHANPAGTAQELAYGGIQTNIMLSAPVCTTIFDPPWTPATLSPPIFAGGYLTSGIVSAYGILQNIQPFRFEITVNWSVAGVGTATIFGINASATTYFALTINTAGRLGVVAQGLTIAAAAPTAISSGADHSIAITCNDTVLTLYVDGVSVATAAGSLGKFQTPVSAFAIGGLGQEDATAPVANPGWTMSLKEFSAWSTATYNGPPLQPYVGSETNLVSLAHLSSLDIIIGPDYTIPPIAAPNPDASSTPIFQILGPIAVLEGNTATYTINRFGFTGNACTVNWAVQNVTAYLTDFAGGVLPSGTASFGATDITISIPIPITNSGPYRNPRQYNVVITNPSNSGSLDLNSVQTIITDTLAPPVGNARYTLGAPNVVDRATPGNPVQSFVVTRTVNTTTTETILWRTDPGPPTSATSLTFAAGVFPTGSVVFNPGDVTKTINVTIQSVLIAGPTTHYALSIYGDNNGGINVASPQVATVLNTNP